MSVGAFPVEKESGDKLPLMLTVDQVRELIPIGRDVCYQMLREGKIPTVRFGRRYLIPRAGIEKLIQEALDAGIATAGGARSLEDHL